MNGWTKSGLVIGGYVLACLSASGFVYLYQWFTQSTASQASAGMSALSDLVLFVVVFGVLSLLPTGLVLYFLFRKLRAR